MTTKDSVNILVVDDSSAIRRLMQIVLKQIGFTKIRDASTACDAISMMKLAKDTAAMPDIVISDWTMPQKSGYEFLCEIRKISGYEHIPFIMLTSNDNADLIVKAALAGVTDYIIKPFDADILEKKLCSALKIM